MPESKPDSSRSTNPFLLVGCRGRSFSRPIQSASSFSMITEGRLLMACTFVGGAAPEHFLGACPDLCRDRGQSRIGGDQNACLLPECLHDPAALPDHLVLLTAKRRQRIGVFLLELVLPISAVVVEQALIDEIAV